MMKSMIRPLDGRPRVFFFITVHKKKKKFNIQIIFDAIYCLTNKYTTLLPNKCKRATMVICCLTI